MLGDGLLPTGKRLASTENFSSTKEKHTYLLRIKHVLSIQYEETSLKMARKLLFFLGGGNHFLTRCAFLKILCNNETK